MKKRIFFLICIVIILSIKSFSRVSYSLEENNSMDFSDIKGHWAESNIKELVKKGIINGYVDKSGNKVFKPNEKITVSEFIKLVMSIENEEIRKIEKGEKWYIPYIEKAINEGVIEKGEFKDYTRNITREEMARIVIKKEGEKSVKKDYKIFEYYIPDYKEIKKENRDYVLKAYKEGIITGYSNREFNPKGKVSRAEATSVIMRLMDESKRKVLNLEDEKVREILSKKVLPALLKSDKEVFENAREEVKMLLGKTFKIVGDEVYSKENLYDDTWHKLESNAVTDANVKAKNVFKAIVDLNIRATVSYYKNLREDGSLETSIDIQIWNDEFTLRLNEVDPFRTLTGCVYIWFYGKDGYNIADCYLNDKFSTHAGMEINLPLTYLVIQEDEVTMKLLDTTIKSLYGVETGEKILDFVLERLRHTANIWDNPDYNSHNDYSVIVIDNLQIDYIGEWNRIAITELEK